MAFLDYLFAKLKTIYIERLISYSFSKTDNGIKLIKYFIIFSHKKYDIIICIKSLIFHQII